MKTHSLCWRSYKFRLCSLSSLPVIDCISLFTIYWLIMWKVFLFSMHSDEKMQIGNYTQILAMAQKKLNSAVHKIELRKAEEIYAIFSRGKYNLASCWDFLFKKLENLEILGLGPNFTVCCRNIFYLKKLILWVKFFKF